MEYSDIKRLLDDMGNSKVDSLDIEFPDGTKIKMKKNEAKIIEAIEPTSCKRSYFTSRSKRRTKSSGSYRKLQRSKITNGWNFL